MSKQHQQAQAKQPIGAPAPAPKLPGDSMSADEERRSQESTLAQIKREMDAERTANEARERAMVSEFARAGVKVVVPADVTPEDRARSHDESVAFILAELKEQDTISPPRPIAPQGGDDASIELIKAEMAKSRRRIVLPSG